MRLAPAAAIVVALTVGCGTGDAPEAGARSDEPKPHERELAELLAQQSTPEWRAMTRLHEAVSRGDLVGAERLIDSGVAADARDVNGRTPLMSAAEGGDLAMVDMLLHRGADPNARDRSASTPLTRAALHDHVRVVLHLLQAGAAVNAEGFGSKALALAVSRGNAATVRALLNAGADLGGGRGARLLEEAEAKGYDRIAAMLRGAGVRY